MCHRAGLPMGSFKRGVTLQNASVHSSQLNRQFVLRKAVSRGVWLEGKWEQDLVRYRNNHPLGRYSLTGSRKLLCGCRVRYTMRGPFPAMEEEGEGREGRENGALTGRQDVGGRNLRQDRVQRPDNEQKSLGPQVTTLSPNPSTAPGS